MIFQKPATRIVPWALHAFESTCYIWCNKSWAALWQFSREMVQWSGTCTGSNWSLFHGLGKRYDMQVQQHLAATEVGSAQQGGGGGQSVTMVIWLELYCMASCLWGQSILQDGWGDFVQTWTDSLRSLNLPLDSPWIYLDAHWEAIENNC